MALPIFQDSDKNVMMLQTKWAAELNPLIANPLTGGRLVQGVALTTGSNVINHKLGHKLSGWIVVGRSGDALVHDTQASNAMPELTLQLVSSGSVILNLWVF